MANIKLTGIAKSFGQAPVLNDIDLEVSDGEFVVFVGPSGCGKSTLLRIIAGLEAADAGDVRIGERIVNELGPAERGVAMVFQSYALYPQMSVYENMAFALKIAKRPKHEIDAEVRRAAQTLAIDHLLDRKPKALSGGQRQRVAIGRAIVRKPQVFLFDEPLSNLDAALRVRMRYEFSTLHQKLKSTMVYVTHDQVEAMTLADRIVVLSQGKIEQVGAPLALYERPANLFVAGFIGSPKMNLFSGVLAQVGPGYAEVRLPSGETLRAAVDASGRTPGEPVTLGVRPEHFTLESDVNAVSGTVGFVELLGSASFTYVATVGATEDLVIQLPTERTPRVGDAITLGVDPQKTHVFDARGLAFAHANQSGVTVR